MLPDTGTFSNLADLIQEGLLLDAPQRIRARFPHNLKLSSIGRNECMLECTVMPCRAA